MTNDEGVLRGERLGTADGAEPPLIRQQRELVTSAGYRGMALIDRVKRMSYLLQGNVSQYRALVARLQDPKFSLPIMSVGNPAAHDDLLSEAERLLHNVLTAMSTRVDQERAFMDEYFADDPLKGDFAARVETQFKGDLSSAFLKGLRNYIAHRQLPVAQSRQTITAKSLAITFVLPSTPLLKWDRWPGVVREWMKDGGDVMIVDVVEHYARLAADFDAWLMDRIKAKYADEIAEFQAARELYNQEHARIFGL